VAPEWAPAAGAVGGLADVERIDRGDGPQLAGGALMSWLSAALARTELPHLHPCAGGRVARRRLMRVGRGLGELRLQRLDLCLQSSHLRVQPCNLPAQCGIAGRLDSAARTPIHDLACVPIYVLSGLLTLI
jgi:hypothetical protein